MIVPQVAKKRKLKIRSFYVPTHFHPDVDLPVEYHKYLDEIHYLMHLVYREKVIYQKSWDEYTPLMADILREVCPNYKPLLKALIDNMIFDEPQPYIKGVRATGYRFHDQMRSKFHKVEPRDQALIKRWDNAVERANGKIKWDVHRHLNKWLHKIKVDPAEARATLNSLYAADDPVTYGSQVMLIDMIAEGNLYFSVDDFGQRVHTPITSMASTVRSCLTVDGEHLVGVDIVSSQPYFLSLVVINAWKHWDRDGHTLGSLHSFMVEPEQGKYNPKSPHPIPLPPYDAKSFPESSLKPMREGKNEGFRSDEFNEAMLRSVSLPKDVYPFTLDILNGQFYEKVGQDYNRRSRRKPLSRGEIKGKVFGAFYCHPRDSSLMTKVLESLYPSAMHVVDVLKETDYRRVSKCMQRQESWTMLGMIVKRLMTHHPEVPVVTIHDSILTTPDQVETVKAVMVNVFRNLGLVPKLSVTDYGA